MKQAARIVPARHGGALLLLLAGPVAPALAQPAAPGPAATVIELSPVQLLGFAAAAEARGDDATAEAGYRALTAHRDPEIRNEARFRLAMLYVRTGRLAPAAVLLRAILDDKPEAQRARLELARVLELMGDESGALRLLRAAQAGGLPPEVARFVDRYSAALRSRKPFGASFEIALAPDSNINRATRSDTLNTVLGDFTLDESARPRSGVGLALRGQVYARRPLSAAVNLVGRASGSADLYRHGDYNDLAFGISAGPEIRLGSDRLAIEGGRVWRWYGGTPYSQSWTLSASYAHPPDRKSQIRASINLGRVDNGRNNLLDGHSYAVSASYERALTDRTGAGFSLAVERHSLGDPAYSTIGGQASLFGYHEVGQFTLMATATFGLQEADARLLLLPRRRSDRLYRLTLGATLRSLQYAGFAPIVRITAERNRSTVEIYDHRRLRAEVGLTRAF